MKQILFLILFSIPFSASISAQRKPIAKTPQKTTEQQATTSDGKPVTLKSDGTWQFATVKVVEKPEIKPCSLTLENAPVIRGFKLGMPLNEAAELFGKNSNNPFYGEYSSPVIKPNLIVSFFSTNVKRFKGFEDVWSMSTEFFIDSLYTVQFTYDINSADFTIDQFKSKLSENFNLPLESWSGKTIQCKDFSIEITGSREVIGNSIKLTNLTMESQIKKVSETQRDTFKP